MAKNDRIQKGKPATNVEFGMEFGDINASKHYEIPFLNKEDSVKNNKSRFE